MKYRSTFCKPQLILALISMWLACPCFAGKVQIWMEKGADFSRYKTYQWLPPKVLASTGVVENDPEFAPLIKEAIGRELIQKGLKEVSEGGDLQVSALALAQSIPQLEGFIFAGVTPDFYTAPVAAVGRYNREGTLVVNLIDAKSQKSAWCGMAKETIDNKPGAGKKKIGPAAAKLFKKYPNNSAGK